MLETAYDYLYVKKYEDFGWRWGTIALPTWIRVGIRESGDTKTLIVYSEIHKNKEVEMNPQYSSDFSNTEILKDMSGKISHAFL